MSAVVNPTFSVKDSEKTVDMICAQSFSQQSQLYQDILSATDSLNSNTPLTSIIWGVTPKTLTITFADNRSVTIIADLKPDTEPRNSANTGSDTFTAKEYALIRTLGEAIIRAFIPPTSMTQCEIVYI